jgi:hypothetical protein
MLHCFQHGSRILCLDFLCVFYGFFFGTRNVDGRCFYPSYFGSRRALVGQQYNLFPRVASNFFGFHRTFFVFFATVGTLPEQCSSFFEIKKTPF